MQLRTCILSAVTLSTVMAFGIAAIAADLPKEGTYKGTFTAFGTIKFTAVGKERVLTVWDENGLSLTDGFLDHVTWHCWGTGDYTKGVGQEQGYCVGTDPAGDQIADNVHTEKHAINFEDFCRTGHVDGRHRQICWRERRWAGPVLPGRVQAGDRGDILPEMRHSGQLQASVITRDRAGRLWQGCF